MKVVLGVILFALASPSYACFVPPKHLSASADALVARTENIALVTVTRAELSGESVVYTFKTLRSLKGKSAGEFQLRADALLYPAQSRDFKDHSEPQFWSSQYGRLTMHPDCKVHPSFSVGGTYLAFLEQPYHSKSFEVIHRYQGKDKDKWLQYVVRRTRR